MIFTLLLPEWFFPSLIEKRTIKKMLATIAVFSTTAFFFCFVINLNPEKSSGNLKLKTQTQRIHFDMEKRKKCPRISHVKVFHSQQGWSILNLLLLWGTKLMPSRAAVRVRSAWKRAGEQNKQTTIKTTFKLRQRSLSLLLQISPISLPWESVIFNFFSQIPLLSSYHVSSSPQEMGEQAFHTIGAIHFWADLSATVVSGIHASRDESACQYKTHVYIGHKLMPTFFFFFLVCPSITIQGSSPIS